MTMTVSTPLRAALATPPWRAATLTVLLALSGCGGFGSGRSESHTPGLNVAEAALQSGSGQMALQFSESVLAGSPNNIRAMEIRGDALALTGETTQAAEIFEALLAKDPGSVRGNIGLGRIQLAKDPAAAEALFLTVLRRDPKNLIALNNLGISRDLRHQHPGAQTAYRQALAIDPGQESAQVNLALSMAMSGQGEAAASMLRPKATRAGASVKMKHDYAVVLAMAGQRAEAERVLGQDMSPADAAQVLESVTATRIRVVRDNAPEPVETPRLAETAPPPPAIATQVARLAAARRLDDIVPPDVVQPIPTPVRAPPVAMASQAPMVVRPPSDAPAEPAPRIGQPTDPIAAAAVNARRLSSPLQPVAEAPGAPPAAPRDTISPEVVAIPIATPRTPVPAPTPVPVAFVPPAAPVAAAEPAARRAPPVAAAANIGVEPTAAAVRLRSTAAAAAVQFAAAPTEAAAQAFWQALRGRFPDALGNLTPVLVQAERNGMVFWRVRAEGFGDAASAVSLCARMRAHGQDCFVPRS